VLAATTLAVGLHARGRYTALKKTCKPGCPADEVDRIRGEAIATDVLLGFTVAAAATTVVLYFLEGRRSKVSGSERRATAASSVRFAPLLGFRQVGLGTTIRY
jgi:hypothetical protein